MCDDRFLIIMGMAHSGTTILAKTLAQCSEIVPYVSGEASVLFENEELVNRNVEDVQRLKDFANSSPAKWIMLKRPWSELAPDFFREHFPRARYLCCLKSPEDQYHSWRKTDSLVSDYMRESLTQQIFYYAKHLLHASSFQWFSGCDNFRMMHYDFLLHHKETAFAELAKWLGLDFKFDVSEIISGGRTR